MIIGTTKTKKFNFGGNKMNKGIILITGSVMNSDEGLVNTYKSLISMINIQKYQVSTPLDK